MVMKSDKEDEDSGVDPSAFRYHDVDPEINTLIVRFLGAAIAVHKVLGPGHLEDTYEQALCIELGIRGSVFDRQYKVSALKWAKVKLICLSRASWWLS
jgi:PD-(D/E)XK nuclease superfamily